MPLPEGYLPREDDILVIHVRTRYDVKDDDRGDGSEPLYVHVSPIGDSDYHRFRLPLHDVVGIKRRVFHVGEFVRHRNLERVFGEVAAMSDDSVWVKLDVHADKKGSQGGHRTFHCNELEPNTVIAAVEGAIATMDGSGGAANQTVIEAAPEPLEPPELSPAFRKPEEEIMF
jgi:hypothetical protein